MSIGRLNHGPKLRTQRQGQTYAFGTQAFTRVPKPQGCALSYAAAYRTVCKLNRIMEIWPFKRKITALQSGIFRGYTDWHSHILPGVDDGVKTMEESLRILHIYEDAGVSELWLTPHIMEDVPNTTAQLRDRFGELQSAYHGPIVLHLAAEYMMDNLFEERLESGDLLPAGPEHDHLLVETSCYNPPIDLEGILMKIKSKGYYPILAHPERYHYMDMDRYRSLKAEGIRFQLNLPSAAGFYSPDTKEKAERLLKKGWYEFMGCDIHRVHMAEKLLSTKYPTKVLDRISTIKNHRGYEI